MKVFIEQSGEENKKNIFNKKTGELESTIPFHITYPYPYGYILNTLASNGDELDCYIITDKKLESTSVVECEVVGMVEYFEGTQEDHKILVSLSSEHIEINDDVKEKLVYFDAHYFDNQDKPDTRIGDFLGKEEALEELRKTKKDSHDA